VYEFKLQTATWYGEMCKTPTVVQGCKATYIEPQLPPKSLAFFAYLHRTNYITNGRDFPSHVERVLTSV
jgi:hypothetical protein